MTQAEIESFLAVCRYRTLTKAAEHLYISQSSLSIRLRTLERDLGGALFLRKKGRRDMSLTPEGKTFYDLAVQFESITNQMRHIFENQPRVLRISSLNSIGSFLLPDVYDSFLEQYPDTEFEIQDMEKDAASISIQRGLTDLAFTTGVAVEQSLKTIHGFSEEMTMICPVAANYPEQVRIASLPIRNEIYVPWSIPFIQWHQRIFGITTQPQVSVSVMEQLRLFMKKKQSWAIVPVSVAHGLEETVAIRRCRTVEPIPNRDVYCIMSEEASNPAIDLFLTCLRETLAEMPGIKIDID